MRLLNLSVALSLGLLFSSVLGCKSEVRHKLHPVTGKITVQGVVPVEAELTLYPLALEEKPSIRPVYPTARVREDGTFSFMSYLPDDGAPVGEYKLLMTWQPVTIVGVEEVVGEDRLGNRFASPDGGGVTKVTVKEGVNEIPAIIIP